MSGTTVNYALPYPTGTDSLCNGYAQIQDLAEAVDSAMDSLDSDESRLEIVPFARLSNSGPITQDAGTGVLSFDTTDVDVTGMVDLGFDNRAIHAPVGALWLVGGIAKHGTSGTTGNLLSIAANSGVSVVTRNSGRDNGVGWEGKLSVSGVSNGVADTSYNISLDQSGTTPTVPTVTVSRMFLFWVSDTP